jgi:hypothetical protein
MTSQADKVSAYPVVNPRAPWRDLDRPESREEIALDNAKSRIRLAAKEMLLKIEDDCTRYGIAAEHKHLSDILDDWISDHVEPLEVK